MSLRELYERANREPAPSERELLAALRSLRDAHTDHRRRARIVERYAGGESPTAIAKYYNIERGTVRSTALLAMRAIRKVLYDLPRYESRPTGRGYGKRKVRIVDPWDR